MIKTAKSSHKNCFICGSKNVSLHRIKRVSIVYAYTNHGIFIKHHARCCDKHLNLEGLIKEEEFDIIPTTFQFFNKNIKILLDSYAKLNTENVGVFDKFKDINYVQEDFCLEITGWSKQEFLTFSKFITNVYDTAGRTKDQLIAIYRYWLRKGIDQCSLAMYKNKTSQQQISHYLAQIRSAINKEFVPFFLGAKSKNRDFFIKRNNDSLIELFNLKKDDLAIIVDGTYTRLEKSSNNQFQYDCWSQQKMDLLVKPFIICCTDGYIIDCYGPFKANNNDAKIFEYILETDKDLRNILQPKKTIIFLDRGNNLLF